MPFTSPDRPAITGMGVFCGAGYGLDRFDQTLRRASAFDQSATADLLAQLEGERFVEHAERLAAGHEAGRVAIRAARRERPGDRMMLLAALEAWVSAGLAAGEPGTAGRIGCLVAANNQFDHTLETSFAQAGVDQMVSPRERLSCLDPYAVGLLARVFGFRGHSASVGAQSACSGAAIVQASALLRAGLLDHCLVVAPPFFPSDSVAEMLANLGIVSRLDAGPAIRPFDSSHAGTLVAPIAAALVLSAEPRPDAVATLAGVGTAVHPSTGTEPDLQGEVQAMQQAVQDAGLTPSEVGYVNAHATGTARGDEVEAQALAEVFASSPQPPVVNATKAIIGHGFNSAGLAGLVATCLQLTGGYLHPTPGLETPIADLHWADQGLDADKFVASSALCNTFSFFGINTSLVVSMSGDRNSDEGDHES